MEGLQHAAFAKALEIMSSPEKLAKFGAKSGIDVERFGQQQSREELLAKHNKGLADVRDAEALSRKNMPVLYSTNAGVGGAKPSSLPAADWAALTPVHARTLSVGTTHTGRMLRGNIAVDPMQATSLQTVLEDELGDLVKVSKHLEL
jgi:hypothetical protein